MGLLSELIGVPGKLGRTLVRFLGQLKQDFRSTGGWIWGLLLGIATILTAITAILFPPIGALLVLIYTVLIGLLTWSYLKFKAAIGAGIKAGKWGLGTVYQQWKDYRAGRKIRKEIEFQKEYGDQINAEQKRKLKFS